MRLRIAIASTVITSLVVVVVAAASCSGVDKQTLRDIVGPPPDFHNIDETYLQDAMWRLAHSVQALDDTFNATNLDDTAREIQVVQVLDQMAYAAKDANTEGSKKSHKNVAMNIGKLIGDIEVAKTAAQAHDLAPAKALPATCLACHEGGGGGAQKK